MRQHLIVHRFVGFSEGAQTQVRKRKEFDVAAARKMLRECATLEDIAQAQGLTAQTVRNRLRSLGLAYLISDPIRCGQLRSKGQLKRMAREKASR